MAGWAYRQSYGHYRPFSRLTFELDFAAVQIDTTLYDHQSETRARTPGDVVAAMEGAKEPLLVGFWNADALVADGANHLRSGAPDFESHHLVGVRILDRVGKQIRENVLQQTLVGLDLGWHFGERQFDRTSPVGGRQDFVHEFSHERLKLQRREPNFRLARIKASQEQHFLHQPGHATRVFADGLQMVTTLSRLQLVEVVLQDF